MIYFSYLFNIAISIDVLQLSPLTFSAPCFSSDLAILKFSFLTAICNGVKLYLSKIVGFSIYFKTIFTIFYYHYQLLDVVRFYRIHPYLKDLHILIILQQF